MSRNWRSHPRINIQRKIRGLSLQNFTWCWGEGGQSLSSTLSTPGLQQGNLGSNHEIVLDHVSSQPVPGLQTLFTPFPSEFYSPRAKPAGVWKHLKPRHPTAWQLKHPLWELTDGGFKFYQKAERFEPKSQNTGQELQSFTHLYRNATSHPFSANTEVCKIRPFCVSCFME